MAKFQLSKAARDRIGREDGMWMLRHMARNGNMIASLLLARLEVKEK